LQAVQHFLTAAGGADEVTGGSVLEGQCSTYPGSIRAKAKDANEGSTVLNPKFSNDKGFLHAAM
jgi:hypothetical protein